MTNDYLDVRSPYIKSNVYSSLHDRRNTLSLNNNLNNEKETSDTFLERKIHSISKRVVGDEIRKFAEVASREISTEFNNLEKRLQDHTEHIKFALQNNLKEEVNLLGHNIGKELDKKIEELNILINQTEDKLSNLENFSKNLSSKIKEQKYEEGDFQDNYNSTPGFKINLNNNISEEKEILKPAEEERFINNTIIENPHKLKINTYENSVTFYNENNQNKSLYTENNISLEPLPENHLIIQENTSTETVQEESPLIEINIKKIEKDLNKIIAKFNKKGFLFAKNTFPNIKDLFVVDILEDKVNNNVGKEDLNLIKDILNDLIQENNSQVEYGETVEEYLKSVCN